MEALLAWARHDPTMPAPLLAACEDALGRGEISNAPGAVELRRLIEERS